MDTLRYFADTRTLHISLSDEPCTSSIPVADAVLVDLNAEGRVIAVTVEGVPDPQLA